MKPHRCNSRHRSNKMRQGLYVYTKHEEYLGAIPDGTQVVSFRSRFREPVFATVGSKVTMKDKRKGEVKRKNVRIDESDGKYFVKFEGEREESILNFGDIELTTDNRWRTPEESDDDLCRSRETVELSLPLANSLPLGLKIWFSESDPGELTSAGLHARGSLSIARPPRSSTCHHRQQSPTHAPAQEEGPEAAKKFKGDS